MKRRLQTRKVLSRLARFRELTAMHRLSESLAARGEALAMHQAEQDGYAALSRRYAEATGPGHALHLSRYEILGGLSRATEARLESTAAHVEETSAAVEQASAHVNETSRRRDTHEDRLGKLEARLRAENGNRDQLQSVETWMQTRPAR